MSFFAYSEIKDIMSYLRLINKRNLIRESFRLKPYRLAISLSGRSSLACYS